MKINFSVLLPCASLTLCSLPVLAQNPGALVPDNYIVELNPGATPAAVAARHGVAPQFVYNTLLNGFAGVVPPGILQRLQNDPQVARILPDREVVAFAKPGGGSATARQPQVVPAGVTRIGAPAVATALPSINIGVAVVDTGIDINHPDLKVSTSMFSAIARSSGVDDQGHGTHVAGIIAAKNDGFDVVGVAPGATLYAVKVLDRRGSGTDSSILAGLNWVAENFNKVTPNIRVVNMSLGRPGTLGDNPSQEAAVQNLVNLGITVVVAAGNECSAEVSGMVPACYPNVISVGSTTAANGTSSYPGFSGIPMDTASYFTTDGAEVSVSAPGADQENVASTGSLTSVGILSTKLGGGLTRMSGTSMAAPHVAGVAALVYAKDPKASPANVLSRIRGSAVGVGSAPLASPTSCYTFDGVKEGVLSATAAN